MKQPNFYCKPAPGERVETTLQVRKDLTSVIHGVISTSDHIPLTEALVLLFREEEGALHPVLVGQVTTDEEGHFAFWNLQGDILYQIKIFQQGKQVRTLEVTLTDEACEPARHP